MYYAVVEFCKLSVVPTVGGTYEVTCDTLQTVDISASTLRTFVKMSCCILISAVHATVAVVVYRAIAHIVFIHHIYDALNNLWVVGSIAINLNIEDVTTTCKVMVSVSYTHLTLPTILLV